MTQQVEAPAAEDTPKTEQVEEISDVTAGIVLIIFTEIFNKGIRRHKL